MSSELHRRFFARGDVHPRMWPDGLAQLHAECLIEGADPQIEVTARFSQAIHRQVRDADGNPVQSLVAAGRRYDGGEELEEHEVTLADLPNRTAELRRAGHRSAELRERGTAAGTIAWSWEPLHATVEAWVDEISPACAASASSLPTGSNGTASPPTAATYAPCAAPTCCCTAPTAPSSHSPSRPPAYAPRRPNAATKASGPPRSERPATAARCSPPRSASRTTPASPAPTSASPPPHSGSAEPPPSPRSEIIASFGAWRSLVARTVRVGEVPGSNPGAPIVRSSPLTSTHVHVSTGRTALRGGVRRPSTLPGGGHWTSPPAAIVSPHRRPSVLPRLIPR